MPVRQVEPLNEGTPRPRKGRMTWLALVAIALFFIALAFVILRPVVDRNDGPELGPPQVNRVGVPAEGS